LDPESVRHSVQNEHQTLITHQKHNSAGEFANQERQKLNSKLQSKQIFLINELAELTILTTVGNSGTETGDITQSSEVNGER
jgi:hypothetical protein